MGCSSAAAIDLRGIGAEIGWSSYSQSWEWKGTSLYEPEDRVSGATGGVYLDLGGFGRSWLGARGLVCYNRRGASRYTADYLSVPLLATVRALSRGNLELSLAVGAGAEFLLRDDYDLPHVSGVVTIDPVSDKFEKFNFGGYARVGVALPAVGVWVQYYRDLTSPIKHAYSDAGLPESVENSGLSVIVSVGIASA